MKLSRSVDSDPSLIRVCDGCGISNYCSCETEVGESIPDPETADVEEYHKGLKEMNEKIAEIVADAESIPFKIEPEITVVITPKVVEEVHTVGGNEFAEIEDEVQSEDAAIPEEVDAAEQPTDGDVNVTEDAKAQIRAQIADLEALLKEAQE